MKTTKIKSAPRPSHRPGTPPQRANRRPGDRRPLRRQRRTVGSRWTVIFDGENLLAPLERSRPESLLQAFTQILELTGTRDHARQGAIVADRGIVRAVIPAIPSWMRPRVTPDRTPNSADRALIRWLRTDAAPLGYDHLVLVSGDGDFAEAADEAKAAGREITVIARRASISAQLVELADRLIQIEYPPDDGPIRVV